MGGAKRMMEEDEDKRALAADFAVSKGLLQRCEMHEELHEGDGDLDAAYRTAAFEFARGLHPGFSSQREMTDYIKKVFNDNCADECPSCERWRES